LSTPPPGPVFTLGHGTRSFEELIELLGEAHVGLVADVRRFPASRRHPHFTREALELSLPEAGLAYRWYGEGLGGRRKRRKGEPSRHPVWRNDVFQAYADYMDTPDFRRELSELENAARRGPAFAIMCAETLWWRCHRRLIADALTIDGFEVVHLIAPGARQEHKLHEGLRLDTNGHPVYDVGAAPELFP